MTSATTTAATLTIASRRRASTRRRVGCGESASSRAADAAIESFRQNRRRWPEGDDSEPESAAAGIRTLAANVVATVEAQGVPRWLFRLAVLGAVGGSLSVAVFRTLPLLARHGVSGIAMLDGKPLGRAALTFHALAFSPTGDARAVEVKATRTDAAGRFEIARTAGLRSGLYAVVIRPGESGARIPDAYSSTESTPLRFELREDLSGVQLLVQTGVARGPKGRR